MGVQSPIITPSERGPLGQYLWTLRKAAQMTLREVEEASGRKVSNAYLSQIETGRISSPSPAILQELARVYESRLPQNPLTTCSYSRMMELAGHLLPAREAPTDQCQLLTPLAGEQLTPDEEDELLKYLAFIRMKNNRMRKI